MYDNFNAVEMGVYHFELSNDPSTSDYGIMSFVTQFIDDTVQAFFGMLTVPIGAVILPEVAVEFIWGRFYDPTRTSWAYKKFYHDVFVKERVEAEEQ